jgi:type I restriction-modification system DNA methylase subunit
MISVFKGHLYYGNFPFLKYKPHEYGEVILPMTVIKRFHDTLLPTREDVLEATEKYAAFAVKDGFLQRASGYIFLTPVIIHLIHY